MTKFNDRLIEAIKDWYKTRKTLNRRDFEYIGSIVYDAVYLPIKKRR